MQSIILAMIGMIFSVTVMYQVSPSVTKYIQAKKADNLIEKEKAVFDAVKRYITIKGTMPTAQQLIDEGYIDSNTINDNGWGNPITLNVNSSTGVVTLDTDIPNSDGKTAFLTGWKHWIKPTDGGGNTATSQFVIPTDVLHGNAGGVLSGAVVSDTAPDAASSKYWYDTSSGTSVLKLSDGTNWSPVKVATEGGGGIIPPTAENTSNSVASLPTNATEGDVRYVYNEASKTIDTYAYYASGWSMLSSGGNTKTGSSTVSDDLLAVADGASFTQSTLGMLETGKLQIYVNYDDGYYKRGLSRIFSNNGDGTVTDARTGLMWQDDGLVYSANSYQNALDTCEYATYGGYTDWVLPSLPQLFSILEFHTDSTFQGFIRANSSTHWTSTTNPLNSSQAITLSASTTHNSSVQSKAVGTSHLYLRCVRDAR